MTCDIVLVRSVCESRSGHAGLTKEGWLEAPGQERCDRTVATPAVAGMCSKYLASTATHIRGA